MNIDRNSHVPVYWQIKEDLYKKIVTGVLKTDDQIPSEPKLAEMYNVSRLTARNAVTELVNEGYLYRVHGQGTFVCKPRVETSSSKITSFMEDMTRRGFSVHSKVLIAQVFDPDENIRELLKLSAGDKAYYLRRLRFANAEPIVLQDAFLPCTHCKGLLDENLETESLYDILRNKYNLVISLARESLEARAAEKEQAEYLQIDRGAPILYSKRLTMLKNDIPIEYVTSWYRGDRYIFEIELK
ncbi:MAG: GntR family transcriptional regulator [Spirochaetota bacterium]